jgi:hypothetical protein
VSTPARQATKAVAYTHAEYPHIDSVAYQQSQLASDLEPRRVLVGQLHGMLRCINTKSQKSLAVLDSNIERQVELDVTILSKENDALAKELNELIFKKYTLLTSKSMVKQIERIPKNLIREPRGLTHEQKLQLEYDDIADENKKLREKLEELILIKERMSNIIEICEINSHQNERWLIVDSSNEGPE